MATSGTIGNTRVDVSRILEKAVRRCGLSPQVLTPEIVDFAKEDLFLLLMGLIDRGLNLWCIDRFQFAVKRGQATYTLPVGTLDILNAQFVTPFRLDYTQVSGSGFTSVSFADVTDVVEFGVKFSVLPTAPVLFQSSEDGGSTWKTLVTISEFPEVGMFSWHSLPVRASVKDYRVQSSALGTVSDLFLSAQVREIQITPFNRDDYSNQPDKNFMSTTVTNYFFEKLVTPRITFWPVPSTDERFVAMFRYRQIQDVGSLTTELELPTRWYEAVIWQLALRLAFEFPSVDSSRRAEVSQMADKMLGEVEGGETDSAPVYFAPNIRGYTR